MQISVGVDRDDRRAHDRVDPGVGGQVAGQTTAHKIAVGHDPDQMLPLDDGERAHASLFHDPRRLADCPIGTDANSRAAHSFNRPHHVAPLNRVIELSLRHVVEVLHGGVGTREEQRLVPVGTPTDDIRRTAIDASHLEHFTLTVRLTDVMSPDHDPIAHARSHGVLLLSSHRQPEPTVAGRAEGLCCVELDLAAKDRAVVPCPVR